MATVGAALARARATGASARDAQVILGHVLRRDRGWLLAHPGALLGAAQAAAYADLVARRRTGEPVAYLTGQREFFGLAFHVSPAVLVPRPETEHLVEAALEWAAAYQPLTIADAGTGCGAMAVSLAAHLPQTRVVATDISRAALAVAAGNAERHAVAARLSLVQADLLAPVRPGVDLIVSNPPYIPTADLAALEVARHEPRAALDGGPDGLEVIRRLLGDAARLLARPGLLLVEIGAGQGPAATALARDTFPEAAITILPDYAGHGRVLRVALGSPP
jgi:release factor glutamine methyltransferase